MLEKQRKIYLFIFLTALLLRLIAVFNYNLPLGGDEYGYNGLAKSIIEEGRYYVEGEAYSRPPLYPFFISIIYFLFGYNLIAVRIIQAILDSLLCILIYKLCHRLFNRSIALVASLSLVCYPLFIKGTLYLLTETLFTLLLFWVIFYIYKTKERLTYGNMCILGIGMALLVLTKGIVLLLLPFLFLALLMAHFYQSRNMREIVKKWAVTFMVFVISMSIWTYRNYKVYHTFIPVSTQTGYALYDCYFPVDGKIFGMNVRDENVRYAMSLNSEVKMSQYLTDKTLEFIKKNPIKVLRLELLKLLYFWSPFDWEIMGAGKNGVYNYQYVFMFPFSLFGMILLIRKFGQYVPFYVSVIYLFLLSLVFYGSPRIRMPIEPYLIIFFAVGISKFFKVFKNRYIPATVSLMYLLMNFMMYLNSDVTKHFFRNIAVSMGLW